MRGFSSEGLLEWGGPLASTSSLGAKLAPSGYGLASAEAAGGFGKR